MGSFAKTIVFPAGYFRASARWLLRERRDVAARVEVIGAEIARIGFIKVVYQVQVSEDGDISATHRRIGFAVSEGSTLARLVQAYVAGGGNPWDISSFMYPDATEYREDVIGEEDELPVEEDGDLNSGTLAQVYPGGGIVAPTSVDYSPGNVTEPGSTGYQRSAGGHIVGDPRYHPDRGLGGRVDPSILGFETVMKTMGRIRGWANQAIKEKLQDLEWRIIKQADLREQLVEERDSMLAQAFGGALQGLPDQFDENRFNRGLMVQSLIQDMNDLLFESDGDGSVRAWRTNAETGFLYFVDKTDISEMRDNLGV